MADEPFVGTHEEAELWIEQQRINVRQSTNAGAIAGPGKSLMKPLVTRKRAKALVKRRTYPPVQGTPPSIEWIAVCDLMVDETYQRSIASGPSQSLIATIASRWDWRLCMPLAVSRRDVGRCVIDGQHRLAAAKLRGDIPHLPCSVATYNGPADEALMFVAANRARRAINRLDDFHAALVAGDEDALEIRRVVEGAGLKVSRKTGSQSWLPGEVAFTSSIQKVAFRHGEELAQSALAAIARAFPNQVLTVGAALFLALTKIMILPPFKIERERLFATLRTRSMVQWGDIIRTTKGNDARAAAIKQTMLDEYVRHASEELDRLAA